MPASVPEVLAAWMQPFAVYFTPAVWRHVLVLVAGALIAPGRRTVTAALRIMGLDQAPGFAVYHRVLSLGRWSPRGVAHRLLLLLVAAFVPTGRSTAAQIVRVATSTTIVRSARTGTPESNNTSTSIGVESICTCSPGRAACVGVNMPCGRFAVCRRFTAEPNVCLPDATASITLYNVDRPGSGTTPGPYVASTVLTTRRIRRDLETASLRHSSTPSDQWWGLR